MEIFQDQYEHLSQSNEMYQFYKIMNGSMERFTRKTSQPSDNNLQSKTIKNHSKLIKSYSSSGLINFKSQYNNFIINNNIQSNINANDKKIIEENDQNNSTINNNKQFYESTQSLPDSDCSKITSMVKNDKSDSNPTNVSIEQKEQQQQQQQQKNEIRIKSMKDLIEVLIFKLQIMEKQVKELKQDNQRLEQSNWNNQIRLKIMDKELQIQKEKCRFLEKQIWRCGVCFKDKLELTSANVAICTGKCGHIYCANCINHLISKKNNCLYCDAPMTMKQIIYF